VTAVQEGEFLWKFNGTATIPAVLVNGTLFVDYYTKSDSTGKSSNMTWMSGTSSDIVLEYKMEINNMWRQIVSLSVDYNYTAPAFNVMVRCPSYVLQNFCDWAGDNDLLFYEKTAQSDLLSLIKSLLASTPFPFF